MEMRVLILRVANVHIAGSTGAPRELGEREDAHADGADQATAAQLDQRLPGLDVQALLGDRPVDQVQIQVVQAQTLEGGRSEEHTSELQSRGHLVCRLLLEKKKHNGCI